MYFPRCLKSLKGPHDNYYLLWHHLTLCTWGEIRHANRFYVTRVTGVNGKHAHLGMGMRVTGVNGKHTNGKARFMPAFPLLCTSWDPRDGAPFTALPPALRTVPGTLLVLRKYLSSKQLFSFIPGQSCSRGFAV